MEEWKNGRYIRLKGEGFSCAICGKGYQQPLVSDASRVSLETPCHPPWPPASDVTGMNLALKWVESSRNTAAAAGFLFAILYLHPHTAHAVCWTTPSFSRTSERAHGCITRVEQRRRREDKAKNRIQTAESRCADHIDYAHACTHCRSSHTILLIAAKTSAITRVLGPLPPSDAVAPANQK